jgi:oxygen-dependent protoporphyrinogen oxidase
MPETNTERPPVTRPHIAVLGAGITGLAAAHRLGEQFPEALVTVFEASGRAGGILQTTRRGDYLVERSADMFTTREPWALDLARRVGLGGELLDTNEQHRRALVVSRGKLHPVPEGFMLMSPTKVWPMVWSPLLSWSAKLRMFGELFVPAKRHDADESLASFTRRRLGREAFERLVQPLVGGIYTADPERLSMAATMPQFVALERQRGSLLRGMLRRTRRGEPEQDTQSGGVRYGQFVAPRLGMQQLIDALVARLPAGTLRLDQPVRRFSLVENGRWLVETASSERATFDGLIYALPGGASEVLRTGSPELADQVAAIPRSSCSVVVLGYERKQIAHPLDAFGFVVPAIEGRSILAGSFASNKFPGRARQDQILLRVFVGGALQPELARLPDTDLIRLVQRELETLLGVTGEPQWCDVVRWLDAMPQYHVGHLDLVARIEQQAKLLPRFALAGNLYRGVGIPFCVRSGESAADHLGQACREPL